MVVPMTKLSGANKKIWHIAKYAVCHPVILAWFEEQRLLYPEVRDLAMACSLAVVQAETPPKTPGYVYKILRSIVSSWNSVYPNDRFEVMPQGVFEMLVESLHANAGFRQNVGKVLLVRAHGEVGDYHQHLFDLGFRDPQLSAIMRERFPRLKI